MGKNNKSMINFNATYVFKTNKSKDDFIKFLDRDLNLICNDYKSIVFINIDTKEVMLLTIDEVLDYKTIVIDDILKAQILFIPNMENYFNDVNLQLINRFHHSWYNRLEYYITTKNFLNILLKLTQDSKKYHIYPNVSDRFKMFSIQNFNDIKVVLVSLDPYTTDDATGIGFATKNQKKPVSLKTIEKELQKQFNSTNTLQNSLIPLVKQGVMFLNASLTSRRNKETNENEVGAYLSLWENFLKIVLEQLNNKSKSIIFVFLGSKAGKLSRFVTSSKHYKILVEHPAKPSYEGRDWITDDLFININNTLSLTDEEIIWI